MLDDKLKMRLNYCTTLPSLPAVAIKIIELANDPDADIRTVCQYISLDPVLSAKLLKTANTPLYKSRRIATNVRQAVSILGTHSVIVIALSFSLTHSLMKKPVPKQSAFDNDIFWRRSITSALACRALGEKLALNFLDDLFLAGLVQDIGILAYSVIMPEEYGKIFSSTSDHDVLLKTERETFGAGHDELGYELLHKWHIPDYIALSCITSHSQPEPKDLGPNLQSCVAVSRYLAEYFLYPQEAEKMTALTKAAQDWLALDNTALVDVIQLMEIGLKSVEELFDINIHHSEATEVLAEAKELLMIHNLSRMKELEEKSQRDGLTGAYNRVYFDETLRREFHLSAQYNLPLTIAIIDLDHFKQINDTYGHLAGDSLLVTVVRTIFAQIRQDDTLSRYGGEEFALILPGTTLTASRIIISRLKDAIAAIEYKLDDRYAIHITASIGVASNNEGAAHFQAPLDMIKAADSALYAAKHAGRNQIIEWSPDTSSIII
ncbi:GGDEF domain-containing protein [Nitrosomonas sp. Nm166]|uniref:GGDEF domain-containing protein n=1 Tax=Nitrosomonas sp. Nm166 TaxID=1881054 RepID=UPI0008F092C9|nr:GGDEF domain-containing protein [Nitrosomonas sp. Nm166]SFE84185.1 diguanylate cyclase (GGDEF) domain-containing protein [Nitrosomonas sp. Nm166]